METTNLTKTVGQAIQEFYNENDFGEDGGVNEKYAWIKFGFFSLPIPNFESRKNNVYLHDVNHIITENNTTWKGESAVSAWEVASGGWNNLVIPWLLTLWAMGLGVVFYTKSTLDSFKKGLTMKNALTSGLSKNKIYGMTTTELQKKVSNHPESKISTALWLGISLLVFLTPFVVIGFLALFVISKLSLTNFTI